MENDLQQVIHVFKSLGYVPYVNPRDTIRHLRGCLWCLDIESENIDTIAISSQKDPNKRDSKPLFMFEYAIRGNLNGINSGRIIVKTSSIWKGFIKKKLETLRWVIPEKTETNLAYSRFGSPPLPGEIWEDGPHKLLANELDNDKTLEDQIMKLTKKIGSQTIYTIYSDRWDTSIRMTCNAWRGIESALKLYSSEHYIVVSQRIFKHIKALRKKYGGLTF